MERFYNISFLHFAPNSVVVISCTGVELTTHGKSLFFLLGVFVFSFSHYLHHRFFAVFIVPLKTLLEPF